jgi:hypothetical protein
MELRVQLSQKPHLNMSSNNLALCAGRFNVKRGYAMVEYGLDEMHAKICVRLVRRKIACRKKKQS